MKPGGGIGMRYDRKIADLVKKVEEAARTVYRTLGPGYDEEIYQRALAAELIIRGIPFKQEQSADIYYGKERQWVGRKYVDFLVDNRLAVEIKTVANTEPRHHHQAIASGKELDRPAMLINFPRPDDREHPVMEDRTSSGNNVPQVFFKDRFIARVGR